MVDLTNGLPSQTNNGSGPRNNGNAHNASGTNMAGTANFSQQQTDDTYANQSSIKTQ